MIADPAIAALVHGGLEYAGIALGVALYRERQAATGQGGLRRPGNFAVIVGLLAGAGIGNKLVFLIERPDILQRMLAGEMLWPGQSIVGGLLGGLIGVELAKWLTRQTRSTGDAMVLPLALGIVIGRIGCFLAGLHDDTFGNATTVPWGLDFGDGVRRHPTQLYEIAFIALLAAGLHRARGSLAPVPGLQFKLFLASYLLWRLLIDGLKPVLVPYAGGLSGIQWVCVLSLMLYLPIVGRAWRQVQSSGGPGCEVA